MIKCTLKNLPLETQCALIDSLHTNLPENEIFKVKKVDFISNGYMQDDVYYIFRCEHTTTKEKYFIKILLKNICEYKIPTCCSYNITISKTYRVCGFKVDFDLTFNEGKPYNKKRPKSITIPGCFVEIEH